VTLVIGVVSLLFLLWEFSKLYQLARAFDLHFNEWRHVNGLRALGIPNSNEFKNITLRKDAIACMLFIYS
jgi:hypothetical protein